VKLIKDKASIAESGQCPERGEDTINNEKYSDSLLNSCKSPQEVNDLSY